MVSSGNLERRWRLSYIWEASLPGRSVRPQPSRNKVSPDTSAESTMKHWDPGVCPGVWTQVMRIDPTSMTSPAECAMRWSAVTPVTFVTPRASCSFT